ncbi:MAG: hypothetical protein JNM39_00900 [Bdellovibrionaceae bacterium]|nr:hypothetical protein [Pseudobdellovibrionaceae bacterium]
MKKTVYVIGHVLLLILVLWLSGRGKPPLEFNHMLMLVLSILAIVSSLTNLLFGESRPITASSQKIQHHK